MFVDGFSVAGQIKTAHPDAFELLSTVKIPAHAAGEEGLLVEKQHVSI